MAKNKTIQDKDLDMPCKHKNHTSQKHIGLKLACQDSSCKRPFRVFTVPNAINEMCHYVIQCMTKTFAGKK